MQLEQIRQQYKDEFVLIEVTKTDDDNVEILEGNVDLADLSIVRRWLDGRLRHLRWQPSGQAEQ